MCSTNEPKSLRGTGPIRSETSAWMWTAMRRDFPPAWSGGRPVWTPAQRWSSCADGESLLVAVVDQSLLPGAQPRGEIGAVEVGLADGVAVDAVGVELVGQIGPALGDRARRVGEHLVDLLAAEVRRGPVGERGRAQVGGGGRDPAAGQERLDAVAVVEPAHEARGQRR